MQRTKDPLVIGIYILRVMEDYKHKQGFFLSHGSGWKHHKVERHQNIWSHMWKPGFPGTTFPINSSELFT